MLELWRRFIPKLPMPRREEPESQNIGGIVIRRMEPSKEGTDGGRTGFTAVIPTRDGVVRHDITVGDSFALPIRGDRTQLEMKTTEQIPQPARDIHMKQIGPTPAGYIEFYRRDLNTESIGHTTWIVHQEQDASGGMKYTGVVSLIGDGFDREGRIARTSYKFNEDYTKLSGNGISIEFVPGH